jgi:hypothetical protein
MPDWILLGNPNGGVGLSLKNEPYYGPSTRPAAPSDLWLGE